MLHKSRNVGRTTGEGSGLYKEVPTRLQTNNSRVSLRIGRDLMKFDLYVNEKYVISGEDKFLDKFLINYLKVYRDDNPNESIRIKYVYCA